MRAAFLLLLGLLAPAAWAMPCHGAASDESAEGVRSAEARMALPCGTFVPDACAWCCDLSAPLVPPTATADGPTGLAGLSVAPLATPPSSRSGGRPPADRGPPSAQRPGPSAPRGPPAA